MNPALSGRLLALRQEGLKRFEALPWPVKTDEEWRRTDPDQVNLSKKEFSFDTQDYEVGWETVAPELIRSGVILTDLATALKQFPELLKEYLFQTGTPEGLLKFTALHQAHWSQGLFCYVPEGVKVPLPLKAWGQIPGGRKAHFPHTLVVVGEGAEVTLVDERRSSPGAWLRQEEAAPLTPPGAQETPSFCDEMVEIVLKAGSNARYIHLQRWGTPVVELFSQRVILEQEAQFLNLTVGLGGRLLKANIETVLQGPGARAELLGIAFGSGRQHFDFHTLQDHKAPTSMSDLLYKSALKDQSKMIYTGLIRIRKQAQKSDAYQANRNLLLSQGAKADSIPMLEIEADDVRCTHGVAIGPVDEEQAFYLMSRGIPPAQAEQVIVEGFFEQVLNKIPVEAVREQVLGDIVRRLEEPVELRCQDDHPGTS